MRRAIVSALVLSLGATGATVGCESGSSVWKHPQKNEDDASIASSSKLTAQFGG